MIAFGCPITDAGAYERWAEPGIGRAAEADSVVLAESSPGSIFQAYNALCDRVAGQDDLEALVLLHQDAELVDPDFCQRIRGALADPEVAIVGCAGAVGVRSIAWWDGQITWARYTHVFGEMGGGELPGLSWSDPPPPGARTGEVDSIDGLVIVMSPWAVRELRFDESLGNLHGYDLDICLQARAAGRKVVTADFRVVHHHSLDLIGDREGWIQAHMRIADKWSETLDPEGENDWESRARRARAEADSESVYLRLAQHHITRLSEDFHQMENSRSWKLTAPLRALGRLGRRIRGKPPGRQLGEGVVRPGSAAGLPPAERPPS